MPSINALPFQLLNIDYDAPSIVIHNPMNTTIVELQNTNLRRFDVLYDGVGLLAAFDKSLELSINVDVVALDFLTR